MSDTESMKRALAAELSVEVEDITEESGDFYGFGEMFGNGREEYIVFESSDAAEAAAVKSVEQQLDDEPELFSPDFLQSFI
jgi:hypothetical protein